MKYCNRCLYPQNHPLGIIFDYEGVCSGCRVHEEKEEINWNEKLDELGKVLEPYKYREGSHYDCIIPVNGNGDSFFVVDLIKNTFGLNPLLVTYNPQFNTKVGIRNQARLITKLDCDHLSNTVGPDTAKRVTRITLKEIGDIYWHVLAGTQTFPAQVAVKFNIPLIIWGVNGWLDQVGMFSHYDQVEMTKKVRKEHSLRRFDAESLIGLDPKLSIKDLQAFIYPSNEEIQKIKLRGIYIGNYVKWDAQYQTEKMINKYGYESAPQERTFNTYETIFCSVNAGVHDYIKYLKYGFGKATDHACRDIRLNRITREDGIELIKRYDHIIPKSLKMFLTWLEISETEFYSIIDEFRDAKIWEKDQNENWIKNDHIENHLHNSFTEKVKLQANDYRKYQETNLLEGHDFEDDFILNGRSYIDENNFKALGI